MNNEEMFCFQCQETAHNQGCTKVGMCGKQASTANLQDLLIYQTKALCEVLNQINTDKYDDLVNLNLFITITNANFDDNKIKEQINKTIAVNKSLCEEYDIKSSYLLDAKVDDDYIATNYGDNEDIVSLRELITYGLKGLAAYLHHAHQLGYDDHNICIFMQKTLARLNKITDLNELLDLAMETGEYGLKGMELLDKANIQTYGNPEISEVNIGVGKNSGILVSGHDLKDLEELLKQSEDSGVDIYTHSEMLPAHYYPKLKKYKHFVGNYGNAWWQQTSEFEKFNGPILLTTNCLVPPKSSYKDRIYTTGAVGFDGCRHIEADENGHKDFSEIIEHAKKCEAPEEIESGKIIGGFAHNQVHELRDDIVKAINDGVIKGFVVLAGCDGRHTKRNYYTEFAKAIPDGYLILTAGCAKYRYNKLDLPPIGNIPRVLDAGQCNDSYSLIRIALDLQDALNVSSVNDLPIYYNIAWYEQKAVIVLLTLLSLNIQNIHLGPTLPAFVSENVLNVLIDKFNLGAHEPIEKVMPELI